MSDDSRTRARTIPDPQRNIVVTTYLDPSDDLIKSMMLPADETSTIARLGTNPTTNAPQITLSHYDRNRPAGQQDTEVILTPEQFTRVYNTLTPEQRGEGGSPFLEMRTFAPLLTTDAVRVATALNTGFARGGIVSIEEVNPNQPNARIRITTLAADGSTNRPIETTPQEFYRAYNLVSIETRNAITPRRLGPSGKLSNLTEEQVIGENTPQDQRSSLTLPAGNEFAALVSSVTLSGLITGGIDGV